MNVIYKTLFSLILFGGAYPPLHGQIKPVSATSSFNPDSILQSETAIVNGIRYTAINAFDNRADHHRFYVKDQTGKIVYDRTGEEIPLGFKFMDFNGDGYKDITLELRGVDSGAQDLVIYDPKSKTFKLAGNCSNAERVPKTKFYYTYEDCCMGRNWSSDLFYIANSKIINVGHIKYNDGDGLAFHKVKGKKLVFIKKWKVRINGDTPVSTGKHIDFDLGLYWMKHWRGFVG